MSWEKLAKPPKWALRSIGAGRLKGKTDINPQWRYQAMTETYGTCGIGWGYEIKRLWLEPGTEGQMCAFAEVALWVVEDGKKSEPIPGIGGNMMIVNEKNGLHTSDEAYKMAVTDALSVAMKMLGMAAAVYAGQWDGSKYTSDPDVPEERITPAQAIDLAGLIEEAGRDAGKLCAYFQVDKLDDLTPDQYRKAVQQIAKSRT